MGRNGESRAVENAHPAAMYSNKPLRITGIVFVCEGRFFFMQKDMTRRVCVIAVLIAMQLVLGRIASINVGSYLKIGFGFIPIAVCGILAGPLWTVLMASACDILGALLFPSGAFYWGFTLVAAVGGLIYGFFLYKRNVNLVRCMLCTLTVALICNILLNTFFLIRIGAMVSPGNEGFWSMMWTRIIKNAVQFPVNGLILFGVWRALMRIPASIRTV